MRFLWVSLAWPILLQGGRDAGRGGAGQREGKVRDEPQSARAGGRAVGPPWLGSSAAATHGRGRLQAAHDGIVHARVPRAHLRLRLVLRLCFSFRCCLPARRTITLPLPVTL